MLETWAPDGTPMQRIGDRVLKSIGEASVGWSFTGASQSGTIVNPLFSEYADCEAYAFITDAVTDPINGPCKITFSGNTLTWCYPKAASSAATRPNTTFEYGIF